MAMYSTTDRKNIKLLVIEDEQLLREYMADYLEDIGYKVHNAANGSEGIDLFRQVKPDLVMTDLRMPHVNGLEVMAYLKAESPETPIIVISGTGTIEDVVQTIKLGAWDFILKPIKELAVLELAIDRALERKSLIEENRRYRDHLEQEVAKRTKELLDSNKKFEVLFNHMGVSICISDINGTIIETNPNASEFLGYTHEEIRTKKVQELLTEEEARRLPQYLEFAMNKSHIVYESFFKHKDGREIPVEIDTCVLNLDGTPTIFSICRDLTERKSAEKERLRLEKQFLTLQKVESLGLLAGGIAHDFRNILFSISGYNELLKSEIPTGTQEEGYLLSMRTAIQRGALLTNKLSQFTRHIDEFAKVDLHKVIAEAVELLRPNLHNIEIRLDCRANEHEIYGDAALLVNALINLGLNARDAISGKGSLTFQTEVAREDQVRHIPCNTGNSAYIRVQVIDNGSGMNPEVMAHLFEPLFTTKEPGKGTGLGLCGVSNCVKLHKGFMDIDSAVGKGSTFSLWLPLSARAPDQHPAPRAKILVIDDEELARILLKHNLEDLGHEVVLIGQVIEAIDFFSKNFAKIDLVLIDYEMSPLNGRELFQELVKINPALKALFVVAESGDPKEQESWEKGIAGTIAKPFTREQICMTLAKALSP